MKPTVLRGNASEIISIANSEGEGKGVDSTSASNEAIDAAADFNRLHRAVVKLKKVLAPRRSPFKKFGMSDCMKFS